MSSTLASAQTPATSSFSAEEPLRAAIFQRLHPRVYLERFAAQNIRPDGRDFTTWRNASINVGSISTADGSALVRLGETTIVCGVKAEIAEPDLERPDEGFLVPNLDLTAMCSPKFKPGPPSEEAQVLSDRLNEALLASGMLSLSSLCIQPLKSAWVLYVDATCINYDGNAFDAALLAMVAALMNTRLPKATFDEESGRTLCFREPRTPLEINRSRIPISTSFGVFDSTHILFDPTAFEEPLLDSTISIVLGSKDGNVIAISQHGTTIDAQSDGLSTCIKAAREHHSVVSRIVEAVTC
ncbi:hypothetical protein AX17_002449 [Amanita inopinata Kibby_2008]|nr:hypothetical protein AX17_002449 [Amanita inopinata Kibby_2008]